jgi:Ca2+-binding RTX toxin-like protein
MTSNIVGVAMPTASYTPTNQEQELLELLNRARANPAGEFDALIADAGSLTGATPEITSALRYFGVDAASFYAQIADDPAVAPLAWNANLSRSSEYHTGVLIATDSQTHQADGEPDLGQRITNAGYTGFRRAGENVYSYSYDVIYGHAGFYIDWGFDAVDLYSNGAVRSDFASLGDGIQDAYGHRVNMLSPYFSEVGMAMVAETDSSTTVGPNLITQNFGDRWGYKAQVLGVVVQDLDGDRFYDAGEGLGGVLVTATNGSQTYTTTTWSSGGYQMELPNGTYTMTFSGGALSGSYQTFATMSGQNIKVDAFYADATTPPPTGDETLDGDTGDNTLRGFDGADRISGGLGRDRLDGGKGNDSLFGGDGDDILYDGFGVNEIDGESGDDRIVLLGGSNAANGGADSDFLSGGFQADLLKGGDGNDVLAGDPGFGIGGSDRLFGGAGDDTMMGGAGADVFVFKPNEGSDVIGAFELTDVTYSGGYSALVTDADFQLGYDHIDLRGFATVNAGNVESFLTNPAATRCSTPRAPRSQSPMCWG